MENEEINGSQLSRLEVLSNDINTSGKSVWFITYDGLAVGVVGFKDTIKSTADQLIKDLSKRNIRTTLASGDKLATVKSLANHLGINEFYGEISPEGKLDLIKKLQSEGNIVGMVGDGKT